VGEDVGESVGDPVGEDVGESVGDPVGEDVGEVVGEPVGEDVGTLVGDPVGEAVGDPVGEDVGESVGDSVGEDVGDPVGDPVGDIVGDDVGEDVGDVVGEVVGDSVGYPVGDPVGDVVGNEVGEVVGDAVGAFVGLVVGEAVGNSVGSSCNVVTKISLNEAFVTLWTSTFSMLLAPIVAALILKRFLKVPSFTSNIIWSMASWAVTSALVSSSMSQLFLSHNSENVAIASIVTVVPVIVAVRRVTKFDKANVLRRPSGAIEPSTLRKISPPEMVTSMVSTKLSSTVATILSCSDDTDPLVRLRRTS